MRIKQIKAWINIKCSEFGKIIYPNKMMKVKPERIESKFVEWKLCEKCFNEIFTDKIKEDVKEK